MPEIRELRTEATSRGMTHELIAEITRIAAEVTGIGQLTAQFAETITPWWGRTNSGIIVPRRREHRSRQSHLEQAVRAARYFLSHPTSPHRPTEQDICDFIAQEEGIACPRSTLTHRWRRLADYGEEIITIDEVVRIARS